MIENTLSKVVYVASGTQRQWDIPFEFYKIEDVHIYITSDGEHIEEIDQNYYYDEEGKFFIYPTEESELDPIPAGTKVLILRETKNTQEEDSSDVYFKSKDVERGLDKLTMQVQDLKRDSLRAVKLSHFATQTPEDFAKGIFEAEKRATEAASKASLSEQNAASSEVSAVQASASATASAELAQNAMDSSLQNAERAEDAVEKLQRVMLYKGSVSTFADLPVINELGDVWNVSDTGANYAWDGEKWDKFSEIVDLKDYVKNTDFANVNTGGVIRSSSYYGTSMQSDGKMCGVNFSLDNYTTVDKLAFISKGTLENAKNDIVKRGIVDNDIILTDTEKQKAKDWLGISGGGGGGGSVVIETEITKDSTDATVPSSKAVWDKVNVLEDRFVEGNPDYVIEGTGNLATIGSREFYKKNNGLAYGMVYSNGTYKGCILVSEIPEAVVINPPSYAAEGSFEYAGRTWYYSPDKYFMPINNDITLGLLKVIKTDTPFSTPLEAARYVIENGLNYKVNGLVTDVTNVKEDVAKLANAYTSSNLKAGTNIALTKAGYHKILSNFSSSKYVKFLKNFNPTSTYRMIMGLTTGSGVTTTQSILSVQGVDKNFYLKGSGSVFSYYTGSSVAGKTVATANTDYWLIFDYDGATCKLYSAKDDGTYVNPKDLPALTDSFWTEELSSTTEIFKGKNLQLGKNGSTTAYWFGSINLGKVLITADEEEWFNGLTAEEGIDYTNLGCTVTNERVEGIEAATTIDCLITKTSQLENDSGFLTSAEGAGASFPLFYHTFADHILNDASWLRGDTFSWQNGDVYVSAYNHLVEDYESTKVSTDIVVDGVQYYAWKNEENIVYTKDLLPTSETTIYAIDEGSLVEAPYTFHSSTTSQLNLVANTYIQIEDTPTTIPFARYSEMVYGTKSETIGSTTIEYATATDGHKIVLADQEEAVSAIFAETGVAWYYILDTENKRFKLPRTKWAFTGLRNTVGNFVEAGLPNIIGAMGQQGNRAGVADALGAFYGEGSTGCADASGAVAVPQVLRFDASRSSEVYGKSDTVQPNATEQYLYFYVGNTVRNQTEIDVGALTEEVNKIHDYVTESYNDGNGNWSEKYKSGKVRQGGLVSYSQERDARKQVTLLLPMKDANYFCSVTGRSIYRSDTDLFAFNTAVGNITTTGFLGHIYGLSNQDYSDGMFWMVEGQGAE